VAVGGPTWGPTPSPVRRKVTIEDVAAAAGVSRATVSRVITDSGRVSADTRAHVIAVIAQLGYRPDTRARSLAGGPSGVVGLLTQGLCSSYITQIVHHFDAALAGHGLQLMVCSTQHRGPEATYVSHLSSGLVDGFLILCPTGLSSYLGDLQRRRFPHVLVDVERDTSASAAVTFDNEGGITTAVQHLLSLGHRRFGFVTGDLGSADARERLDAFHRSLSASGVPSADRVVIEGDWCEPSGYDAGLALLSLPVRPTAVVVSNDLESLGVLRAARVRGVQVPTEVSVVGCDDIPEAAQVHPSLTTVRQPLPEIGRAAARLLHEQITGSGTVTPVRRLGGELVVRETTASAPA
jgi:LacI family transcriptional regulator